MEFQWGWQGEKERIEWLGRLCPEHMKYPTVGNGTFPKLQVHFGDILKF